MTKDTEEYIKKCETCQKAGPIHRLPAADMTTIVSPVPFAIWGIDIVGMLPACKWQFTHAIVAVDYFSKLVEAKAVTSITCRDVNFFFYGRTLLPATGYLE